MATRLVEGKKPYTGGKAIEITKDKVINLKLRDENNLIIYDDGDNEIYVDLQLPNEVEPTDAFPVGVNVGRVIVDNGWDKAGTLISAKTTSGDNIKLLYADDGTLWIDNGTGTFKQIYFKADVDLLISTLTTYINTELAKKQNGVTSGTAPSNPSEGDLWYDTTSNSMKVYDGTNWNAVGTGGGGSDIVYATQAEYNALLPGALTDNKHYFIYTKSGEPIPSVISCDFTQSDEGFTFDNPPTTYGRDSNGFYVKSDYSWGALGALIIPQTIIDTGTPTMIKLYAKNMDSGAGAGIYKAVGDEFARYFNGELNMSPSRGTPHTLLTGTAEDVFVLDFDNEICYLESAPGTTATIYSSTILNDWGNGINLCIMSPNSRTYGYLTKAEFYF